MTNNDRIGSAQTLVLVNGGWDMLDDVHAMVTLGKNDRTWGTAGGDAFGHSGTLANNSQAVGAGGVQANTFVDQAYMKIDKVFGAVDTTIGRQFYGTQGDIVAYYGPRVGVLGMPITALDTLRADWSNDMVGVTGTAGKVTGSALGTTGAADLDLQSLTAMLKGHENMQLAAGLYHALVHASAGNGGSSDLFIADLKGKASMGAIWAGAELAKDFGQDRTNAITTAGSTYTGWAAKLDAGLKADLGNFGSIGPWGEYDYGTGQGDKTSRHNNLFTGINPDFRAGDIYTRFNSLSAQPLAGGTGVTGTAGYGATNTLANKVIWGLGVKLNPSMWQKLSAGVAYWDYRQQTSPLTANGSATQAFSGNKHLGSEADLDLGWKHSENVSFDAGVGRFWAGGQIDIANAAIAPANTQGTNPATAEWFDVHVKF